MGGACQVGNTTGSEEGLVALGHREWDVAGFWQTADWTTETRLQIQPIPHRSLGLFSTRTGNEQFNKETNHSKGKNIKNGK